MTGPEDTPSQTDLSKHSQDGMKHSGDLDVERFENIETANNLSQAHREYLLKRHGTIDLEPIPSSDPADPYNWPTWKKVTSLVLVSFHAMMTTFVSSAIIPVYETLAQDLGTSIKGASYLTSLQIVILGYSPLFWKPISNRYGRRPVWLISTIGALLFNVGSALSKTYTSMAICRAFEAFFISPPIGIGSAVVTELFFKKQRAQYLGIWTLLVTLGPPAGPFFMGFVAQQTGDYTWIYWVLSMINAVQFLAYLFFAPETLYHPRSQPSSPQAIPPTSSSSSSSPSRFTFPFHRLDPTPFTPSDFLLPLTLGKHLSILVPTLSYTFVFGFCSVLVTVEIPQIFVPKFGLNPQQLGLQFLGVIVGSILGEQLGGRVSDLWMLRGRRKKRGGTGAKELGPEYRLWISYGGFVLAMVGLVVFGVRVQQAHQGRWNVTPIIGIGVAAAGNQIVTTVLVTYAVDCHPEHSGNIGVFVNVIRSTWGFIGPFWYPDMLSRLGGSGSGGLMAGVIFVFSLIPIAILQWWGTRRHRQDRMAVEK